MRIHPMLTFGRPLEIEASLPHRPTFLKHMVFNPFPQSLAQLAVPVAAAACRQSVALYATACAMKLVRPPGATQLGRSAALPLCIG